MPIHIPNGSPSIAISRAFTRRVFCAAGRTDMAESTPGALAACSVEIPARRIRWRPSRTRRIGIIGRGALVLGGALGCAGRLWSGPMGAPGSGFVTRGGGAIAVADPDAAAAPGGGIVTAGAPVSAVRRITGAGGPRAGTTLASGPARPRSATAAALSWGPSWRRRNWRTESRARNVGERARGRRWWRSGSRASRPLKDGPLKAWKGRRRGARGGGGARRLHRRADGSAVSSDKARRRHDGVVSCWLDIGVGNGRHGLARLQGRRRWFNVLAWD